MSDHSVKGRFEVSTRLLGCIVEFRDGSSARVDEEQLKKKLFRETRTRKLYDAEQMLLAFHQQSPEHFVGPAATAQALEKGASTDKPDLHVAFPPGEIFFRSNSGITDVARVVFDLEFTSE